MQAHVTEKLGHIFLNFPFEQTWSAIYLMAKHNFTTLKRISALADINLINSQYQSRSCFFVFCVCVCVCVSVCVCVCVCVFKSVLKYH